MNVLVIGRGGREHSIVHYIAKSEKTTSIYAAPGNSGMAMHAICVSIQETDIEGLVTFAKEKEIDLTIVGPEDPLNAGIANRFRQEGLAIFAPTEEAALLEGSKSFAKRFMDTYEIPTAAHASFTNREEAKHYIEEKGAPIVVKADGLAAGKGVIVAQTKEEAIKAVDDMLVAKAFKEAGKTIVIEECLIGKEFSLMAFVHGNNVYPLLPARDHKRAYDNDEGPNTGGMGAYAPVPGIDRDVLTYAQEEILQKAADGMVKEDRSFTGILYAGLMQTEDGPKVIEFNTRFGDPETQVILPLLENDLLQVLQDVLANKDPMLKWKEEFCVGVVVAAKGYPGAYEKRIPLPELVNNNEAFTIHAGIKYTDAGFMSSGGRVLLVGSLGKSIDEARNRTYHHLENFRSLDTFFYRKDIGLK